MKNFLLIIILFFSSEHIDANCINTSCNDKISELLTQASELEKITDYKNALEVYNRALKITSEENLVENVSFINKKIGLIYYKQKNYNSSKVFFKRSIDYNSKSKNAADSYFNLALIYRKEKKQDSLLWALNGSLSIYDTLDNSDDKFSTYLKAGILYKNLGHYNKAISYLLLAYDGFSLSENLSKKASVSYTIGEIQRLLNNFEIAEKYLFESLQIRKKLDDTLKTSYGYNNLANLYKDQKKYDSAIANYRQAIIIQKRLTHKKEVGKMLNNLGGLYFLIGELDLALNTYKKALKHKKSEKDTLSLVFTYNELALVSIKNKKSSQAKQYLDSAGSYLSGISKREAWLRYYEVQSEYFNNLKKYDSAYVYKTKQLELFKKLFNTQQVKNIQELQEKFESQLKEGKISNLTLKNSQKESIINTQRKLLKNRNLLLSLFGVLILFLIGVYFYIKQRQKIKLTKLEYNKLKAVLDAQEVVKDYISKDLHDIITTSYDGVRLKILALSKASKPEAIHKSIIKDIKEINSEIRLISHRLSPLGDKIKEATLTEIIISHLSEFQYYRKLFVAIQLPLPDILNDLKLEAQTNFYGILLEVLNNTEKHAQATEFSIKHKLVDDNNIQFEFCDNGIGFNNDQTSGIGLINIKQRSTLLLGEYQINTSDKGTCLLVSFPIKPNLK